MLILNSRDPRPIYEQVRDELRKLIVTGAIAPGEKLPSVRELASQLAINPNTIQRAYRELEQAGFVVSFTGKGSFAAQQSSAVQQHIQDMLQAFDSQARELMELGVTQDTLISHIKGVKHDQS